MVSLKTLAAIPAPSSACQYSPLLSTPICRSQSLFFFTCFFPSHRHRHRHSHHHHKSSSRHKSLDSACCALSPRSLGKQQRPQLRQRTMVIMGSSLHVEDALHPPSTQISDKNLDDVDAASALTSGGENIPSSLFPVSPLILADSVTSAVDSEERRRIEKAGRRNAERSAYLFAAVASTAGITFLTLGAIYYRFAWQTQGMEVPFSEMFGTFSLAFGASVGMEYWARWAHRALWHDSLWSMHESHHRPRDGPFELNDVFAIINAVPAIALIAYGFFHAGFVPGLCFGAGLGITMFGIAYMFVHDGLVHRRFPVGPIADVPYFQKVAAAHQLHHADKFKGVPYGLFLGPQELEAEEGGAEELERMMQLRKSLTPKA